MRFLLGAVLGLIVLALVAFSLSDLVVAGLAFQETDSFLDEVNAAIQRGDDREEIKDIYRRHGRPIPPEWKPGSREPWDR